MNRRSRIDETGSAFRGSQHQIQLYVNDHTTTLSQSVIVANPILPRDAQIESVSPLQGKQYREYWDSVAPVLPRYRGARCDARFPRSCANNRDRTACEPDC
jgi:hypothetical protein